MASNVGASRRGYTDAARDSVVKLAYRVRRWFEKLLTLCEMISYILYLTLGITNIRRKPSTTATMKYSFIYIYSIPGGPGIDTNYIRE